MLAAAEYVNVTGEMVMLPLFRAGPEALRRANGNVRPPRRIRHKAPPAVAANAGPSQPIAEVNAVVPLGNATIGGQVTPRAPEAA